MSEPLSRQAGHLLALVREQRPRVHCVTNTVVQEITANVLLAAGAIPSMTISPEEIGDFVAGAHALLINLGTFDRERRDAVEIALEVAGDDRIPWVLDPVLIDRSRPRAEYARALAAKEPRVVRANGSEFAALSGGAATEAALDQFALDHLTVAACTGAVDFVSNGARRARIANGDPRMARVTGIGCAESALIAAFLSVEDDGFVAAAAGLLVMGIAGEIAAATAKGAGSFAVALIDAIESVDVQNIEARAKLS